MLVVLVAAACGSPAPSTPEPAPPVVGRAGDRLFRLELVAGRAVYHAGEPLHVEASVTYHGADAGSRVFHGASPVSIGVVQLDGPAALEVVMAVPCASSDLARGVPLRVPFQRSGLIEDEPPFDMAWFRNPELRLPPGRWRFSATMSVMLDGCGRDTHDLVATADVTVLP